MYLIANNQPILINSSIRQLFLITPLYLLVLHNQLAFNIIGICIDVIIFTTATFFFLSVLGSFNSPVAMIYECIMHQVGPSIICKFVTFLLL